MAEDYVRQVGRGGERGVGLASWRTLVVVVVVGLAATMLLTYALVPALTEPAADEAASSQNETQDSQSEAAATGAGDGPTARIVTEKGDIVVQLRPDAAPRHVENFIQLSDEGFYDGLTFHRVVPGFVIQGGDPAGDGSGGPGYTLPAEIGLPHEEGALAAARLPDPRNPERESSGSQFYITLEPQPGLDGQYTVYGYVLDGMDVVRSIEQGDRIDTINVQQ